MTAGDQMMRLSALLSVLSVLIALADSPSHAASFDEGPAYGPQLEGFDYPWAVQHFRFTSQGEVLDMAYMDVKPVKPRARNGSTASRPLTRYATRSRSGPSGLRKGD
jgi:hypothetical protein